MRDGPGVDRVLDLHRIEIPSESVGTVLILDTLEHVEYPRIALEEVYRILKLNGIIVITSVMNFPIHDYPCDYWRFTPEGFKSLLKHFGSQFVDFAGNKQFPHTVVGVAVKGTVPDDSLNKFRNEFVYWKKQWRYDILTQLTALPGSKKFFIRAGSRNGSNPKGLDRIILFIQKVIRRLRARD
jgi:SAM-dependent methyltransferase